MTFTELTLVTLYIVYILPDSIRRYLYHNETKHKRISVRNHFSIIKICYQAIEMKINKF